DRSGKRDRTEAESGTQKRKAKRKAGQVRYCGKRKAGGSDRRKRDRSDIVKLGGPADVRSGKRDRKRKAGQVRSGKRDRSDIVKLGGPADVRAIFTRARHFDFVPPFAGAPWDDRPTLAGLLHHHRKSMNIKEL